MEFLKYPVRIYPVGRLDKDSEGLLLMTNQGELVNRILRGRYGHEKEYLVTVDRPVTEALSDRCETAWRFLVPARNRVRLRLRENVHFPLF